jgi:hypothetical protein
MAHGPLILRLFSAIVACEAIAAPGRVAHNPPPSEPKPREQTGRHLGV